MLNLINQNIQMANQIAINNNILKMLMENSSPMNNNNQVNNQNILRPNETLIRNNLKETDFLDGKSKEMCNVLFVDELESQTNLIVPIDIKMEDLLLKFWERLKKEKKLKVKNIKDYTFLYASQIININEQRTIYECGLNQRVNKIIYCIKNNTIGG